MTRRPLGLCAVLVSLSLAGCGRARAIRDEITPGELSKLPWREIVSRGRGSTVNFGMWAGDEERNRYFRSEVADVAMRKFAITLRMVPNGDTAEVVNKLLNEKGAGKTSGGSIDVVWINGENFRTARRAGLLWGPFTEALPAARFYDEQARSRDFGTDIGGYEAPWQKSQFVMAYDTARVQKPPQSLDALLAWAKTHPGRFTYVAPPDFTGSAFIRHAMLHFGGYSPRFQQGFDQQLYRTSADSAIRYLNVIKPYMWRQGETYPSTGKELDRLFANNEVDFAMNYSPAFASARITRGEFPQTTRTFVFDEGTIGNYNYLAIPFNARNVYGALLVIDFLMSFEQALGQSRALDSAFPLDLKTLSPEQRAMAEALPRGSATLPAQHLASHFLAEPDAEYLTRLEKDWIEKVLRR